MRISSRILLFLVVFSLLFAVSTTTFAAIHTAAAPKARVTARVDNSKRTTLYGHVPVALRHAQNLGRVEPNKSAEHLIIVLKSDEEPEARASTYPRRAAGSSTPPTSING